MAVGLCEDGNDDGNNGGDDPLIRELDLDNLATQVPPDLLESSQPSVELEHTTSDPTPTPEVNTHGGEREVLIKEAHISYKDSYCGMLVIG